MMLNIIVWIFFMVPRSGLFLLILKSSSFIALFLFFLFFFRLYFFILDLILIPFVYIQALALCKFFF